MSEAMTNRTKLLTMISEVIHFHCERDSDLEELAQATIDATADWLEDVLDNIGIQPSAIPTLLRWQAHQHEYLDD
jgi:hypothetical protein